VPKNTNNAVAKNSAAADRHESTSVRSSNPHVIGMKTSFIPETPLQRFNLTRPASDFCKITVYRDEYYNAIKAYVNIIHSILGHIITSIEGFRMFLSKTSAA
jgi:hypothetical protein